MVSAVVPTGRENHFELEEVIVSKTDLKGHITYANDVFVRVSRYSEAELLGKPHNLIRHPGLRISASLGHHPTPRGNLCLRFEPG
jgi:PAS domain-containing protein